MIESHPVAPYSWRMALRSGGDWWRVEATNYHTSVRRGISHRDDEGAVLSSYMSADRVAERVERMFDKELGLDITVLVRAQAELARAVRRDPLALLPRLRH